MDGESPSDTLSLNRATVRHLPGRIALLPDLSAFDRAREIVRLLRTSRPEQRSALLGSLLLTAAGYLAQPVLPKPELTGWLEWVPAGFALLGLVLWGLTLRRLWRSTMAPVRQEFKAGPVAIKGAASFAPDDGELFSRLGRQEMLGRLWGWIQDDQVPVVVVMGDSGVGKTSLLRAGLHYLAQRQEAPKAFRLAYWEAHSENALERLKHAVQAQLGTEDLTQVSNAALLIDQAEQLRLEPNPGFFNALRHHLETNPPYTGTWIVAMRRDAYDKWMEFELSLPDACRHRIKTLLLEAFKPAEAQEVLAVLAEEAQLPLGQAVAEDLILAITQEGQVSPVDLGITLQVLGRNQDLGEDVDRMRSVGGHAALLTSYLEDLLAPYSPELRDEVLRALLTLAEVDADRRLPAGRTPEEIIQQVEPVSARHLELALGTLAQPGVRVLEVLDTGAYRLMHERFVPALRRLAGKLLDEVDQASRLLERRFHAWDREEQRSGFLLSGRDLQTVTRHQLFLRWGENRTAKQGFIERSLRRRSRVRLAWVAVAMVLSVGGYLLESYRATEAIRDDLVSWGIPGTTYDILPRLTALDLSEISIPDTEWLRRAERLEDLSVKLAPQTTGEDLAELPRGLQTLTLDLRGTQVSSLKDLPPDLQTLTLYLRGTQVSSLKDLPPDLQTLTLYLRGTQVSSLPGLPKSLAELYLTIHQSQARTFSFDGLTGTLTKFKLTVNG